MVITACAWEHIWSTAQSLKEATPLSSTCTPEPLQNMLYCSNIGSTDC